MRNSHTILACLLTGTTALMGCGSASSGAAFNGGSGSVSDNQVVPLGSLAGSTTAFKVAVPPQGGSVPLPTVSGLTGVMIFAPGAEEGTHMTITLSQTAPPGAPDDGFFYLILSVNKPLELSLLKKLTITEVAAAPKVGEEIRPRTIAPDAELYTAELSTYSGASTQYLEDLTGQFDSGSSQASFAELQPRVLAADKNYLIEGKSLQQDTIPVTVQNNSGIEPAYLCIVGQNPIPLRDGKADPDFYHVSADGKMVAFAGDDRTSYDPNNKKVGWTDRYNIPIAAGTTHVNIPQMIAARMYFTLGRKMQIQINDFIDQVPPLPPPQPPVVQAQPNGWTNSGDPNYRTLFDWLEYDYKVNPDTKQAGIGINKSDVEQFGFGIQFTLEGSTIGSKTLGTKDMERAQLLADLQADNDFKGLIVPGPGKGKREDGTDFDLPANLPLRAASPTHGLENVRDNRTTPDYPQFSQTYFDPYLTNVWNFYKSQDLKCFTSAFGNWYGRVDGNDKMVFTCVDDSGIARAGFDKIYVRKPTTFEAFEPTPLIVSGGVTYQPDGVGPFVPVPQPQKGDQVPHAGDNPKLFTKFAASEIVSAMSAALNRTTLLHEALLTRDYVNHAANRNFFYKKDVNTNRINLYAKAVHDHALTTTDAPGPPNSNGGGAAYAFGFDDNSNQSSFVAELTRPTALKVVITKFQP